MGARKIPSYRLHKPSGQAVTTVAGRDYYLGKYGTPESKQAYDRVIAEWLSGAPAVRAGDATVAECVAAFLKHVEGRYCASQLYRVTTSLGAACRLYGDRPIGEFRGRGLKAVRQAFVGKGYNRRHVNHRVGCVKLCWRWLLSEELAPADAVQSVLAVAGLRRGEGAAPEPARVLPVDEAVVRATLPELAPVFADAVLVQLYSGARPGEVLGMRGEWLSRPREDLWVYSPPGHKTAKRGHTRTIFLGPKAIAVVRGRDRPEGWLFPSPRRRGRPVLLTSYDQAVRLAAKRAGVEHWWAHQLRHLAATVIRRDYGVEMARLILGHRHLSTTELYAEADLAKVAEVMRKAGLDGGPVAE